MALNLGIHHLTTVPTFRVPTYRDGYMEASLWYEIDNKMTALSNMLFAHSLRNTRIGSSEAFAVLVGPLPSNEGIIETIKNWLTELWKKIKAFFSWCLDKVRGLFGLETKKEKALNEALEALKKVVQAKDTELEAAKKAVEEANSKLAEAKKLLAAARASTAAARDEAEDQRERAEIAERRLEVSEGKLGAVQKAIKDVMGKKYVVWDVSKHAKKVEEIGRSIDDMNKGILGGINKVLATVANSSTEKASPGEIADSIKQNITSHISGVALKVFEAFHRGSESDQAEVKARNPFAELITIEKTAATASEILEAYPAYMKSNSERRVNSLQNAEKMYTDAIADMQKKLDEYTRKMGSNANRTFETTLNLCIKYAQSGLKANRQLQLQLDITAVKLENPQTKMISVLQRALQGQTDAITNLIGDEK